jgi:hypothetical protein
MRRQFQIRHGNELLMCKVVTSSINNQLALKTLLLGERGESAPRTKGDGKSGPEVGTSPTFGLTPILTLYTKFKYFGLRVNDSAPLSVIGNELSQNNAKGVGASINTLFGVRPSAGFSDTILI